MKTENCELKYSRRRKGTSMSEDSSYHDALVIVGEHLPEAVRVLPYARHVYAAYQWLRDRRFKAFLTSLNGHCRRSVAGGARTIRCLYQQ